MDPFLGLPRRGGGGGGGGGIMVQTLYFEVDDNCCYSACCVACHCTRHYCLGPPIDCLSRAAKILQHDLPVVRHDIHSNYDS